MSVSLDIRFDEGEVNQVGALVLYVSEGEGPQGATKDIWAKTGREFESLASIGGFSGKPGQMLDLIAPDGLDCDRLVVLGRGEPKEGAPLSVWRDRGGSLVAKLESLGAREVAVVIDEAGATPETVAEMVAGMRLRHYRFDKYRRGQSGNDGHEALSVTINLPDLKGFEAALKDREAVVEGTLMARTLVNEPANALGPVEFAAIANRLSDLGLTVEVLTPDDLAERGMNALLAVAQGSERPARLVVMQWNGGGKNQAPIAFVGKGVVFDTGGISIKPGAAMQDMKGDMGGAAAVTGLMRTLAARKAEVNAVGVVALAENMPDGKAFRPGDIVTAMSGTTIEVVNTDAEGRLVLADALWYTQDRFKPKLMIDLATLTGSTVMALGHDHAGLFSNDDVLATDLIAAGAASGEKVWRMPMSDAYEKLIESRFADIKNTGGRPAGSITAAHFLKHFVNGVPWAHIDIAGTGFGGPNSEINTSWGTGFGVALLDRFVRDHYEGCASPATAGRRQP